MAGGRTLPTYHIYGRTAEIMFGTQTEQRYLPTTCMIDSGIGTYQNDLRYTPEDGRRTTTTLNLLIYMTNSIDGIYSGGNRFSNFLSPDSLPEYFYLGKSNTWYQLGEGRGRHNYDNDHYFFT